ncbi:MAG: type IV toxin-antitoxin system AbiEi family antitoxin domain-containing protein [Candidatus Binatia bacterium]
MERTLSHNEAKVVLDLEWRNQKTVTLAELREALGASENYARKLAHGLVKKGWLERLRPGLFLLVPADRGREGIADTNPLAAGAVLVSPYFYSFGTACTHHGFTEQVFSEVYVACQEDRRPESIRGKRYVFVQMSKRRFFGFEEISVLGHAVQMATPERALLDTGVMDHLAFKGGTCLRKLIFGSAGLDHRRDGEKHQAKPERPAWPRCARKARPRALKTRSANPLDYR